MQQFLSREFLSKINWKAEVFGKYLRCDDFGRGGRKRRGSWLYPLRTLFGAVCHQNICGQFRFSRVFCGIQLEIPVTCTEILDHRVDVFIAEWMDIRSTCSVGGFYILQSICMRAFEWLRTPNWGRVPGRTPCFKGFQGNLERQEERRTEKLVQSETGGVQSDKSGGRGGMFLKSGNHAVMKPQKASRVLLLEQKDKWERSVNSIKTRNSFILYIFPLIQ